MKPLPVYSWQGLRHVPARRTVSTTVYHFRDPVISGMRTGYAARLAALSRSVV